MEKDLIFETKYWNVILSTDQRYLGRCYIPLKRKCPNLSGVTDEEWLDFQHNVVQVLEKKTKKAFGAVMHNWGCLMNDAYQHPSPDPQVHWHFRPRYDKKINFAGAEFEDVSFGNHYIPSSALGAVEVPENIKKEIIKAIQNEKN